MAEASPDEARPLLAGPPPAADENGHTPQPQHGRLEDDVLPEESTLGRNIDWKSAYVIAISRVIGSGIFAVPGVILQAAGSVGLSLALWLGGAVVVAAGLAVSLELGCMLPRSGGDKVYLEFAYPRPRFLASTLVAVQAVLLGFTASNCVIFSQYTLFALGADPSDAVRKAVAVALLTAITVVHGVWYRAGIRIQNFLGWLKVGLVVFMVLSALYVVVVRPERRGGGPDDDGGEPALVLGGEAFGPEAWDRLWEGSDWSFGTIATSLFKVFYSYAGLTNLNNVLNEVKDPVRTLKSVSLTALVTACFLYLLANLAYFAVVPVEDIKQSGQLIAALFFERVFGPNVGRRFLPLAVALSAAGNVMVVTFALVSLFALTIALRMADMLTLHPRLGAFESGDRQGGLPPVLEVSLVFEAIQCAHGRPHRPLHPIRSRHRSPAHERGVLLHLGGGGVSGSGLRPRHHYRPYLAAI